MPVYSFTVEHDGQTYECERDVTGTNRLRQTVTVVGQGTKSDDAVYGQRGHPVSTMESTARLIAHEIITEA